VCDTLGVGLYNATPEGVRWLGDFRGAVPGEAHTFCIDAHFWFSSPAYRYREISAVGLTNRDGRAVSLENQRRLAYALWTFGRSASPERQAAVMLFTHRLMGDEPATAAPVGAGSAVASVYERIETASTRLHGPYRIDARFPASLTVGRPADVVVRVLAASGAAVPAAGLSLSVVAAGGVPSRVTTTKAGIARIRLVPSRTTGVALRVRTGPLASSRPRLYAATTAKGAVNAQRLAAPSSQLVGSVFPVRHVTAAPHVATRVSAQRTAPGATLTDRAVVTGIGEMKVKVDVELWGPYASRAAISCVGSPRWRGSFLANGNGTYETAPVRIDRAGYYTFTESIAARPGLIPSTAPCGEVAETTLVHARPAITTVASADVVRPGSRISDLIRVRGLGTTSASVEVELFGPFPSREAIDCTERPLRAARITVDGNGDHRSPPMLVTRAGIYAFREHLRGSEAVADVTTPCAVEQETAVVAPFVLAGRGDEAPGPRLGGARTRGPVRVRLARLAIDADVSSVAIDLKRGALGIPSELQRTGWWRDGSAPGETRGTVLIAGHVDGAKRGIGAFFALRRARAGDVVELDDADGQRHAYRVATVRTYAKRRLPLSVYSRKGPARLVLVTCGGPFDRSTGHYPYNVVVTATPE
jgi:Sortase domain